MRYSTSYWPEQTMKQGTDLRANCFFTAIPVCSRMHTCFDLVFVEALVDSTHAGNEVLVLDCALGRLVSTGVFHLLADAL
jgi:hypothetical protein